MVIDNSNPPVRYEGTAIVNGTVYRVNVITKERYWKSQVEKAVNRAGGYNVRLDEDKPFPPGSQLRIASVFDSSRVSFEVTFTPDCCLTEGAIRKPPITRLLRSDLSIVHDGELQKGYMASKANVLPNQTQRGFARVRP